MYPPECRNATANAIAYVDVSGRAHRPSPTVLARYTSTYAVFRADAGVRPYSYGILLRYTVLRINIKEIRVNQHRIRSNPRTPNEVIRT